MRLSIRLRVACATGAILLLAAGCTSGSAEGPTSESELSITVSPSVIDPTTDPQTSSSPSSPTPSVVQSPTPTASSPDPAAQEAADRAAIEAQWAKFWDVYRDMVGMPVVERESAILSVAKSPLKETMLRIADDANADGIDNYGAIQHRIYWELPVDGKSVAAIGDCQDQSAAGTIEVSTGMKLTTGEPRVNIKGQLVKEADGLWLVQTLVDMGDSAC